MAHERLFRLGIASNLAVFAIDIALITALYVVLNPIHSSLALMALGCGLVETAVLVVATLSDFNVLRILSGAEYLKVFELDRLHTLARLSVGTHADGYNVGLVFAGLRCTTFCYLWFKSGFIPRTLAGFGVGRRSYLSFRTDNGRVASVQGTATVGAIGASGAFDTSWREVKSVCPDRCVGL